MLQVFHATKDTGIPDLQRYIKKLTRERKVKGTEKVLESVCQFTARILRYLIDEGTEVSRAHCCVSVLCDSRLCNTDIFKRLCFLCILV